MANVRSTIATKNGNSNVLFLKYVSGISIFITLKACTDTIFKRIGAMKKIKQEGDLDNDNAIRNALSQFKNCYIFSSYIEQEKTHCLWTRKEEEKLPKECWMLTMSVPTIEAPIFHLFLQYSCTISATYLLRCISTLYSNNITMYRVLYYYYL